MKKSLFFAIAALVVFASCQEKLINVENSGKKSTTDYSVIYATIVQPDTKAAIEIGSTLAKINWDEGDQITVTDASANEAVYQVVSGQGGSTSAEFEKISGADLSGTEFTATYGTAPSSSVVQTYSSTGTIPIYMTASGDSGLDNLKFTAQCGVVKINLMNSTSNISKIVISDAANDYTLKCTTPVSITTATDFFIVLPAGTYTKVAIVDSDVSIAKKTSSIEVLSGHVCPIKWNSASFVPTRGSADVATTIVEIPAGRTSCNWVQLWEDGPKWAGFNVGAQIDDYASYDTSSGDITVDMTFKTPSTTTTFDVRFSTENSGGLYEWNNYINDRAISWETRSHTPSCDVATTLWGDKWKTPSLEILRLFANKKADGSGNLDEELTVWEWCDGTEKQFITGCDIPGYKISGKGLYEENSIFFPACGYYYYAGSIPTNYIGKYGNRCRIWSTNDQNVLTFEYDGANVTLNQEVQGDPNFGLTVRAILYE